MALSIYKSLQLLASHQGYKLTQKDTDAILEALYKKIGHNPQRYPDYLGQGFFGHVYWLSDRKKVLKITTDPSDAFASEIVRRKPAKNLLKVYDVFGIPLPKAPYPVLRGIVAEKLTPLDSHNKNLVDGVRILWDSSVGKREYLTKKNLDKFLDSQEAELITDDAFGFLDDLIREFNDRRILWKDLRDDNVMARGRILVVSDLGFSQVPKQSLPELQVSEM